MRKNVILIVIDSFAYNYINNINAPNLYKLMNEYSSCKKMYSQAPFTEAAIMPIMTGRSTFSDGGYINKFEDRITDIFKIFHDDGYQTYYTTTPEYFDIHKRPYIDYPYYVYGYYFNCFLNYRLKEFENKELSSYDLYCLRKNFQIMFDSSISFLQDTLNGKEASKYIREQTLRDYDLQEILMKLEEQKKLYLVNPFVYIEEVLKDVEHHPLFLIQQCSLKDVKESIAYQYILNTYGDFLKDSFEFEKENNLKHKISFKFIANLFLEWCHLHDIDKLKNVVRYIKVRRLLRNRNSLTEFMAAGNEFEKDSISINGLLEQFIDWAEHGRKKDKPFFAKIHADDIHYKTSYFSYESDDLEKIDKEMAVLNETLKELKKSKYEGNIAYDYGIRYVDQNIGVLIDKLKEMDLFENTVIAITADHGYSYTKTHIRENFVNNQYLENYNIPFILINGKDSTKYANVCSSLDILPTLIEASGGSIKKEYELEGVSLYHNHRGYALIEYVGMGCPNMNEKKLLLGYINDKFKLVYEVDCNVPFHKGRMISFYDLVKDGDELHNLFYSKKYKDEINGILEVLEFRFEIICKEFNRIKNGL